MCNTKSGCDAQTDLTRKIKNSGLCLIKLNAITESLP